MRKVTFLKVGHHASHNATPVKFVEAMKDGIPAMASVRPVANFPSIPRKKLIKALKGKETLLVLTAEMHKTVPEGFTVAPDKRYVEVAVPT